MPLLRAKLNVAAAIAANRRPLLSRPVNACVKPFGVFRGGADMAKHVGGQVLDERRRRSLAGEFEREEEVV